MSRLVKSSMSLRDHAPGRLLVGAFGPVSATPSRRLAGLHAANKRAFDVVSALVLLTLLAVPLLLIALAVKLDSRGPVFYRVRRVGYRGTVLMMLKFRKMHQDADGIPLTASADPRLTRVGVVLARTRLDELPQLWDVLRGRMSIVGPRPEAPEFVSLHSDAYDRILSVRPGITGLSQLAFAAEHRILDQTDLVGDYIDRILPQKVGLDILYARAYRMRTDLAVLIWTAAAVALQRDIAVHRATGKLTRRRRPDPLIAVEPVPMPDAVPAGEPLSVIAATMVDAA